MPKTSKIASGERLNWLELSEKGTSVDKIAIEYGRDVRTVRTHMVKARLERNFKLAQRDQLRDALHGHQQDMLGLLQNLKGSINVPELDYFEPVGLDYGIEDLWSPSDLDLNRETLLPHRAILIDGRDDPQATAAYHVIRDVSGPQEIRLIRESSRLWRALKEHIRQDPVWRHEAAWRKAYLEELQKRAELNRAIRKNAEEIFGHSVGLRGGPLEPWLAPAAIGWIRTRLMNDALGNYVRPVDEELTSTSPGSLRTIYGQELTMEIENAETHIQQTLSAMDGSREVAAAAESYKDLRELTENVHDAIDDHLLVHYISGLCGLCQKLGGQ